MPEIVEDKVIYFAKTNFRGSDKVFGIKQKDRRQHFYICGKTGTGKSELMKNMILQDINNDQGVCIIDPHGENVEDILRKIPARRINDVVYFNPVDSDYPLGFNILEVSDPNYKHLVVSDLMAIFTKIWANVWSARMEYILQNCVLALLDTPGTTLLGIPRILVDKNYRERIVKNIKDPVVRSFWIHEYESWRDQFRSEAIVPIQNKVGQFLNTPFIRNIVGQPKSTLNVAEIMNLGKILLVNVAKGRIGEDNSQLLGAMIITKLQLAAMERVRILEHARKDYYLYIDEFQNFATDSFANILSEARKYRLNLIVAHQYIGQLVTDTSTKVRDAIFGNVGTMLIFRVGAADAEALEQEFTPEFMPQDLVNLPNWNIYLKLMVNGITSRPFSAATLPPMRWGEEEDNSDKIVRESRAHYGMPRKEIEEKIERWSSALFEEAEESEGPKEKYKTKCWSCGNETTVNFKPDDVRPIYCADCLKKVEAGEIPRVPSRRPIGGGARADKYDDTLAALGIEFKPSEASGERSPRQESPRRSENFERRGEFVSQRRERDDQLPSNPRFRGDGPPPPVGGGGESVRRPASGGSAAPFRAGPSASFRAGRPPSPRSGSLVMRQGDQEKKNLSLEALRPKPREGEYKRNPDLEGLRALLQETPALRKEEKKAGESSNEHRNEAATATKPQGGITME